MKKRTLSIISLTATAAIGLAAATALSACKPEEHDLSGEPAFETNIIADFTQGAYPEIFSVAEGFSNGGVFDVEWDTGAITYDDAACLTISPKPEGDEGNAPETPYYGAGMNTMYYYSYGFFAAELKPSAVPGTCTGFFTYSDTYDTDLAGNPAPHPHDEVDIEFLGYDTTFVQFNYFVNGEGHHEFKYQLDWDASEEYHTYGFYWGEDAITWYIDGEPVYKVEESEDTPLPANPGRVMLNHWSGTEEAESWMKAYDGTVSRSYCKNISVTADPLDADGSEVQFSTADFEMNGEQEADLALASAGGGFQVTRGQNGYEITADAIAANSYDNVFNDSAVKAAATDKNAVSFTVTNNGDKRLQVKADVLDSTIAYSYEDPALPKHQCINYLEYQNGREVSTNYEWGGSSFVIDAGDSAEITIIYNGIPDKVALFFNSHMGSDATSAVDAQLSPLTFGVATGNGIPEPAVPAAPELPFELTEDAAVALGFNGGDAYTLSSADGGKSYSVSYEGVAANSYKNITVKIDVTDKNAFAVTITNTGEKAVNIKIDVIDSTIAYSYDDPSLPKHQCVNTEAYADGKKASTDLTWGGSSFTVGAGETSRLIVIYDGTPDTVNIFFDSHLGTTATSDGSLTIGEFTFGVAKV